MKLIVDEIRPDSSEAVVGPKTTAFVGGDLGAGVSGLAHASTTLIAGAGRSGTTWLGKLLDASPSVFYKPEPDNLANFPWFNGIPSRIDPTPDTAMYREP